MARVPDALWHAAPLHYVPAILADGALLAQTRLATEAPGVRPRHRPARRLRALGLTGYVFLSFASHTPLLADKRRRGFPHALLRFDPAVLDLSGVALVRYNTKAWSHRDDFAPVTDPHEKAHLLAERRRGRLPSLECLVPDRLSLAPHLVDILLASEAERDWLEGMLDGVGLPLDRLALDPMQFPPGPAPDLTAHAAWAAQCCAAGVLLPPPDLPFD